MGSLSQFLEFVRRDVAAWRQIRLADLLFSQFKAAFLIAIVMAGLSAFMLLIRVAMRTRRRHDQVAVPAFLSSISPSRMSLLRHAAFCCFVAGLPFFMLALAAPYKSMSEQQVSYPGRRIALMIDASGSMMAPFPAGRLKKADTLNRPVFFTSVAAANVFIRQRMQGKYHDVIALVEFGDQSYVITPFTNDYKNILLSISLIGDHTEFVKFPDLGTTIGSALEQSINLFKAFNYLDASGNAMVIFSDGQDTQVTLQGKTVTDVLADAVRASIPVYFIRTFQNRQLGDLIPDGIWKPAVEATGGRFYAAAKEEDVIQAIRDIDRRTTGKIELKQYSTEQTEYAPFTAVAAGLWAIGLGAKLTIPHFNRFP